MTDRGLLQECKQFLEDMHSMPVEWTIKESQELHAKVKAQLAVPAQAEPVNAEALHAECKRVAHNAIHDAIYKIDDCEPVKDAVRDALDSIDLSEFAAK